MCVLVLTLFLYCFVYVYLLLFVLSVLVKELLPPSEKLIAVNNNNNNIRHMKRLSLVCLPLNASYSITSYGYIIF